MITRKTAFDSEAVNLIRSFSESWAHHRRHLNHCDGRDANAEITHAPSRLRVHERTKIPLRIQICVRSLMRSDSRTTAWSADYHHVILYYRWSWCCEYGHNQVSGLLYRKWLRTLATSTD